MYVYVVTFTDNDGKEGIVGVFKKKADACWHGEDHCDNYVKENPTLAGAYNVTKWEIR